MIRQSRLTYFAPRFSIASTGQPLALVLDCIGRLRLLTMAELHSIELIEDRPAIREDWQTIISRWRAMRAIGCRRWL